MYLRAAVVTFSLAMLDGSLAAQMHWSRIYPPVVPPARESAAMAVDSLGFACLLGGDGPTGLHDDMWKWDGSAWTQYTGPRPSSRFEHDMVFDSQRGRIVLFGGSVGGGGWLQDTWEWNGSAWLVRAPATRPSPRSGFAMAYDPLRGRTVLFSGSGAPADTWEWDGTNWSQRFLGGPPARQASAMAFDPVGGRVLLYGGSVQTHVDDTWSWNGTTWTRLFPITTPFARASHRMVTDFARSRIVMFGMDWTTWEWDGVDWNLRVIAAPMPRRAHCMVWSPQRREVQVHFGLGSFTGRLDDTWTYTTFTPALVEPFGTGCPGSAGTPVLANAANSYPWLGDTLRLRATSLPMSCPLAVFATGLAQTAPVSLAPYGMPGCDLFVSIDAVTAVLPVAGVAERLLAIPNVATFVGLQLFEQAFVLDAAAAGGATVSNAVRIVAGMR